jgi:L-amino acid N-acyltransferase YncA
MTNIGNIRSATPADAAACAAIYAPYVADTAITFETQAPSVGEMAERIEACLARHAWLVLEVDGAVKGYAYAGPFKTRAAYQWSCESTIYLEQGLRRTGAGRALYGALLARLVERGYRRAVAIVAQPNEASNGLHHALGFTDVGTLRKVGWKHDAWHDVAYLQLDLTPGEESTVPPAPIS